MQIYTLMVAHELLLTSAVHGSFPPGDPALRTPCHLGTIGCAQACGTVDRRWRSGDRGVAGDVGSGIDGRHGQALAICLP